MKKTVIAAAMLALATITAAADGKDAVVKHFQGQSEKTAKDAVWTSSNTFAVGVIDNGSDRSGYAEYVCAVFPDFGIPPRGIHVKIIDVVKLKRTGKWEKLGETYCK